MPPRSSAGYRNEFTSEEEDFLVQYMAKYNPAPAGRTGNKLYQRLVENAEGKWPWHKRHTWQSWRERYRNNNEYFDRRIAKNIRKAATKGKAKSEGSGASTLPTLPPPPRSPPSEKRERVPYTMEDDDNLAEYLAANSVSHRGRQGKNLYEAIADEPWGERHTWQSWHERYRKNQDYFDRRIQRIHAGEDDGDESDVPRPRTVDGTTRYSLSQSRMHAKRERERSAPAREKEKEQEKQKQKQKEKRKRASRGDEGGEAPPRKKTRVEQPVAGPSRRKPAVIELSDEPEAIGVPDEQEGERPRDDEEQVAVGDEDQDEEGGEGGAEQDEDELGEDEEEDEDEEDEGPVGPEDYCGEIFDSPHTVPEADEQDGSESESDREQEETELMLSDNPFPDGQDMDEAPGDDADVDMDGDETVVEAGDPQHGEENPFDDFHDIPMADDDETEPHLSTTPPSGASPPARTHNTRIERDIDAQPDTPELSPAEDANARHQREHGHEPAPARKHATRILRKGRAEEDFFGTPSTSAVGTAQNSPTARHVARKAPRLQRDDDDRDEGEGESPQKRQREPPRMDEGAWNTAFSDGRGRARGSPKRPRRSGVDFGDFEDAEAQEASEDEGAGAGEEVDATPLQWPPVRGRAKGKGKAKEEVVAAPTTPAHSARDKGKAREAATSPGEGRVVTTEHILSVKTIRTVERRPVNGIPAVGLVCEPAADEASSPRTLVQEDQEEEGREEVTVEPPPPHPFSQLEPLESRGGSSSRGSSIFPRVGGGKDSRKEDIARMQKMLAAGRSAALPQEQDKEKAKNDGGILLGRKIEDQASFLRRLATGGGPTSASELFARTTRRRSPVGTTEDVGRRGQRLARFQEREESLPVAESVPLPQSSPLARRNSNPTVDELVPHASTSRTAQGVHNLTLQRVDKGKARADAPPSGTVDSYGHPRRHPSELEADFNPTPRDQSTVVRRRRRAPRQSLPALASYTLGEDPYMALSHMFQPPPSGSGLARLYTLPSRPSLPLQPSLLSHPSAADPDASLYGPLPAHERAMIKALGMQCALAAVARNHGFGEETVRAVCAQTGSMEKTDRVLRDMRESANERANETLRAMLSESDEEEGGEEEGLSEEGVSGEDRSDGEEDEEEEPEDAEDAEEDAPAEDVDGVDEELPEPSEEADEGDSAEVESVLGQDNSWLDDVPQAESSRIRGGAAGYTEDRMDVDVGVSHVTSGSTRKRFRIKLLPKEPAQGVVYSPPKKTRASHFIKKAQKAELVRSPQRGPDAMEADPFANAESTVKPRYANMPTESIGQLSKYDAKQWMGVERKYGPGAAKIMMGKALASLLPGHPQQ
ncbi:hypothetical protein LXA43DRAFT_1076892 [Ganoderma leucocontextum]|nr:hypothetical protein LXA43DRAFT_1076892 [Ganoderma leucocontextum]